MLQTTKTRQARALHTLAPALGVIAVLALAMVVIPVIIAVNGFLAIPLAIALWLLAVLPWPRGTGCPPAAPDGH